jgi:hypothetical protein
VQRAKEIEIDETFSEDEEELDHPYVSMINIEKLEKPKNVPNAPRGLMWPTQRSTHKKWVRRRMMFDIYGR